MSSFQGKVIAITGGASGIGLSIAKILHSKGAKISIADWSQDSIDKVASNPNASEDEILTYQLDVRDLEKVQDWLKKTVEKFGKLDGAANMAGVTSSGMKTHSPRSALLEDQEEEDWETVLGINLTGMMHCMKEELKLIKSGGAIVNAASIAGIRGLPHSAAYGASKFGVVGLTKMCAKDYGPKGIRINAIAPGFVDTPMLQESEKGREASVAKTAGSMPIGRKGKPEEIANVAVFLLSDEASYVTGQVSSVDGGWSC